MTSRTTELLAPAGSLSAAITAFEAGADAVYLGLKAYSARSAAANFTFDELRRLKTYATAHQRHIYVAINTIITDAHMAHVMDQLCELAIIGVDGVIIQDLGLLTVIRDHFPTLEVHASTQMAVHNEPAIALLKHLGVRRFILARELSLDAMKKLRTAHPDTELEVFCHGALCYSFSGMCLASGLMLQRSANRGMCAQLCRNYYTQPENGQQGYFFAMNDLALGHRVRELCQLGLSALKIEGRMKSPTYVARVVALYRLLIDQAHLPHDDPAVLARQTALQLSFARRFTFGYFTQRRGENLLNPQHAGHMGLLLGEAHEVKENGVKVQIQQPMDLYDNLMFLPKASRAAQIAPRIGSVVAMRNDKGKKIISAPSGTMVTVTLSGHIPHHGDQIYLLKKGGEPPAKSIDIGRYAHFKTALELAVSLTDQQLIITTEICGFQHRADYPIHLTEGERPGIFADSLTKLFNQSATSRFGLGTITIGNHSQITNPFVPPSALKQLKNQFYASCDEFFSHVKAQKIAAATPPMPQLPQLAPLDPAAFAGRSALNPQDNTQQRLIPFVLANDKLRLENLAQIGDYRLVPLMPIVENPARYFGNIAALISAHPHVNFLIGINNVGHIAPYLQHCAISPNVACFLDVYCYVANRWTLAFFTGQLPKLLFYYAWVEQPSDQDDGMSVAAADGAQGPTRVQITDPERLPYFISLACYKRHHQHDGKCPADCSQSAQYTLTNQEKHFHVIVRDCVTWLFAKKS